VAKQLLKDEAIGGKLILIATVLALIVANTSLNTAYDTFWGQNLKVGLGQFAITLDLSHWVSEGLMAIFFLVVGLEIKREAVRGELKNGRTALLPIGAAIGGMIVPAAIFLLINHGQPYSVKGWAIPIATDIAFALGVMSLLGDRISSSLRLFLLTLAIVDDIGAILVIALFYSVSFSLLPFLLALSIATLILISNKWGEMPTIFFVVLGIALWIAVYKSGIHASIAGAFLGFLAPLRSTKRNSIAETLEKLLIPISTFIVVPLFAFASLGITLGVSSFGDNVKPLVLGIICGLVIGKVAGVSLSAWILVKLRLAELPANTNWFQIIGVGFLAGIGFTVSVFITDLAFPVASSLNVVAKLSVLIASTISAITGYAFLRHRRKVEAFLESST
jgi:NhaA family Na+:H+ antiporter